MSGTIYGFKMLFRKSATTSAVLSIALLVAIIASMNFVANYIGFQTQILSKLVPPGGTYIILSENSAAITDSRINPEMTSQINNTGHVSYVLPQKLLTANLTTQSRKTKVTVRGVDNAGTFMKLRKAHVNGTAAKNLTEANIGEVLANILSIKVGDQVELTLDEAQVEATIKGIFRSQTQSDTEIIVPIETTKKLARNNNTVSLIEFTLKEGVNIQDPLNQITQLLPENAKLVQAQQLKEFAQEMSTQTLDFLNVWSLATYAVVAAASYITVARLTSESSYEFTMLKVLGAKKTNLFTLVLKYTATTALLGAILGIALGITGAQTASTLLNWIWSSIEITPFIETQQALQTLLLTLISSILGCLYPSLKFARIKFMEQPL